MITIHCAVRPAAFWYHHSAFRWWQTQQMASTTSPYLLTSTMKRSCPTRHTSPWEYTSPYSVTTFLIWNASLKQNWKLAHYHTWLQCSVQIQLSTLGILSFTVASRQEVLKSMTISTTRWVSLIVDHGSPSTQYTGKCAACVKHAFLKRMFNVHLMHGERVNRVTFIDAGFTYIK